MKLRNFEIEKLLMQLEEYLCHTNVIGYAAARNTRLMSDAIYEYTQKRDELIAKYGSPVLDKEEKGTGEIALSTESKNFPKFLKELRPYAEIEQEVNLVTLKYEQAIGLLSGTELLELDWMFED
jgi:hypothetical protein